MVAGLQNPQASACFRRQRRYSLASSRSELEAPELEAPELEARDLNELSLDWKYAKIDLDQ